MKKIILTLAAIAFMGATAASAQDAKTSVAGKEAKRVERANKRFDKLDTDKNGVVSKEEIKTHHEDKASKHFDKLDTNKDGKISKEEFSTKKERKHKKGPKFKDGLAPEVSNPDSTQPASDQSPLTVK